LPVIKFNISFSFYPDSKYLPTLSVVLVLLLFLEILFLLRITLEGHKIEHCGTVQSEKYRSLIDKDYL